MDSQAVGLLIKRALRQFTPGIFSHPVWIRFALPVSTPLPKNVQPLLSSAKELRAAGDIPAACAVLILCAAVQSRSGDRAGALNSVEQALKLAARHRLRSFIIWGYWAAGAICVQQGAFQRSAGYLRNLHEIIQGDWVLANLVEMMFQALERLAGTDQKPGVTPNLALSADPTLQPALEALLKWGEVLPETGAQYAESQAEFHSYRPRGWRRIWQRALQWLQGQQEPAWAEEAAPEPVPVLSAGEREAENAPSPPKAAPPPGAPPLASPQMTPPGALPPAPPAPPVAPPVELAPPPPPAPVEIKRIEAPVQPAARKEDTVEIQMYFLGQFRIYQNDQPITDWPSQKSLTILKYLAANRGKPIPKDILMEHFWSETDPEVSRRNLHQAIYALRQALKRSRPAFPHILFENDCYRLNPAMDLWLDVEEFEKHVRAARRLEEAESIDRAIAEYEKAEALYQGDFLEEDLYEDWPEAQRVYFRTMYLDMLGYLCDYYFQQNRYYAAILLCRKILDNDSCSEQAYRCLIRCYLAQGQRQLAVREYQNCVQVLKQELRLSPSEETRALYGAILAAR